MFDISIEFSTKTIKRLYYYRVTVFDFRHHPLDILKKMENLLLQWSNIMGWLFLPLKPHRKILIFNYYH